MPDTIPPEMTLGRSPTGNKPAQERQTSQSVLLPIDDATRERSASQLGNLAIDPLHANSATEFDLTGRLRRGCSGSRSKQSALRRHQLPKQDAPQMFDSDPETREALRYGLV
jgi:hypothetical protein